MSFSTHDSPHSASKDTPAGQIVVAGHICVDVIPSFGESAASLQEILVPGKLTKTGPALLSTGGAVSNTGVALHRLGAPVRLMGKVGGDFFGQAALDLLRQLDSHLADGMIVAPNEPSSYTIVINPPGIDRVFLHCPGPNDTFGAADIDLARLAGVRIFHFGYPPIMRRIYLHDGAELANLLQAVRSRGVTTSLDMAQPDPNSEAGRLDWPALLKNVLPHVDIFAPSIDEILYMLDRPLFDAVSGGAAPLSGDLLHAVSERLLDWGAAVVLLKLGALGLYVRTTAVPARLLSAGAGRPSQIENWLDRELLTPCFQVQVAGTTGAGDCTIAGFLAALLAGASIEEAMITAVGVGACSVEGADAASGVPPMTTVQARIRAGWPRHPLGVSLPGWEYEHGLWCRQRIYTTPPTFDRT
jgi:sugar/nucleoside kinase (ribokinase family)